MMKKLFAILLAGTLLLSGCAGGSKPASSGSTSENEVIVIGGLAPLTGSVAMYGNFVAKGAELAFKEINANGGILGKQVDFRLEDEKGDVTEAVNAYSKLMDEKIVTLLGDVTSKPSVAVAELANDDGLPMITPTGTQFDITEGKPSVFRACFTDPYQGEVLAAFTKKDLNAKTVAVLSNNSSEYSQGIAKAYIAKAKELGLEVVAEEGYSDTDSDFRGQLTSIKSKDPDVLLVPDYFDKDALIALQAKEVGLNAQILGADGWDGVISQVTEDKLKDLDGIYYCTNFSLSDENPLVQNFVKNYKAAYNENPASFSANAYDAVYIIKAAIEKAGSTDKEAIVKAMKELDFEGVAGTLHFDENNNPIKTLTMIVIKNGEYQFHSKETL